MKQLLIITSFFLITGKTGAQKSDVRFGFKVGTNITKIAIQPPLENRTEQYRGGFVAGTIFEMPVIKKMKLRVEPLYNMHHSSIKFNPYSEASSIDLTLHQVSLPVQLCYFVIPKLSINAGASANYNFYFSQKVTRDLPGMSTFNITDEIKKFSPALLAGITFYGNRNISVDARYNRTINSFYKKRSPDDPVEYYLGFFQFALGYRI